MSDTPTPAPATPKKKGSLGRIISRICVILFVLVALGLIALYFSRNTLVARGVTFGGKYATEQETALQAADLSLGGTLDLSQLEINNPAGYKAPKFLTMKDCTVSVQPGSFLSDTIVVDNIAIDGLEVTVEQNGAKNNLADLMNIIKTKSAAASASSTPAANAPPASPGKQLKIAKITVSGSVIHIRGLATMDLKLPPITLNEPTNPDGRPMKIADVIAKVLVHLAQQIVENPQLPGDFKNGLKDVSSLVNNLQADLTKDLGKNLNGLTKGLPDAGKNIQNLGNDVGKNLQNLIPGNKPPATKP